MVHGNPRMDNFSDAAVADDAPVRGLLDRITLEFTETVTPDIARPATATIVLKDGSRFAHRSPYPKGHPKNPMSAAEIEGKFIDCARGHLSEDAARAVIDLVDGLEKLDSLTDLTSLVERPLVRRSSHPTRNTTRRQVDEVVDRLADYCADLTFDQIPDGGGGCGHPTAGGHGRLRDRRAGLRGCRVRSPDRAGRRLRCARPPRRDG